MLIDATTELTTTFTQVMTVGDMRNLVAGLERPRRESWAEASAGSPETQISLVLLGGHIRTARVSSKDALQGYRSFKAYLEEYGAFPDWIQGPVFSASAREESANKYWENALHRVFGRAVSHTATGYIGLDPRCARPGDVVAVLYGSNLPMVIRLLKGMPKGSYRLLGTSYVYGIMDDEAVRRHKEMAWADDVFRII